MDGSWKWSSIRWVLNRETILNMQAPSNIAPKHDPKDWDSSEIESLKKKKKGAINQIKITISIVKQ